MEGTKAAMLPMGPTGLRVLGAVGLVLSCKAAGAFVMHVASSCPLVANGSLGGFDLTVAFNKNPLLCYDPDGRRFTACDWGLLHNIATWLAAILNNEIIWVQRAEARRRVCSELAAQFWAHTALRRTPPQVRIVPIPVPNDPDTVRLTCHVWGFYPPTVTIQWLHNGLVVASGDTKLLPSGDWTYQTQVALRASTAAGNTYTCSVGHASLEQPLQEHWSPSLSPGMTVKVAVAAMALTLGLVALSAGIFSFCHRPRARGPGAGPGPHPDAGSDSSPGPQTDPGPSSGPHPSPSPHPSPGPHSGPGPGSASGSHP
ncbi:HLA class II histocompatibility antigen, DM beta chain-like isoform X2 [Numida meleagris]|uniref:HLA class II histocompatibility antigen, DM beta chain-like isoform X2 n=1 Tax=Numida meleagris TaxID=8996 RepID=UPI000B3DEA57|nr:HLA class II histocompatibility antigen, DM beta chain-like isoform X2 [Numida meleagris]